MNILIVTPYLPYPLHSGGNTAQYLLIDCLRRQHAITLVCFAGKEEHRRALAGKWEDVQVRVVPGAGAAARPKPSLAARLSRRLKGSFEVLVHGSFKGGAPAAGPGGQLPGLPSVHQGGQGGFTGIPEGAAELVLAELQRKTYDLVQVEFVEALALVYLLPPGVQKLFVHHEIRFVRMQRELATLPAQTLKHRLVVEHTRWQEIHLLQQYDAVVTLSETDKGILSEFMAAGRIMVSPFPAALSPGEAGRPYAFGHKLVYVGGESHYPNKDAVHWFLSEVWEAAQKEQPGLRFYVTGNWTQETVAAYKSHRNVIFTGYLEALEDVLAGAIMVVPLRIGSGIRSKILEAVARGVPVVSTTIGAEGLPLRHLEECLLADTAAGFAAGLVTLMRDAALQQRLVDNARRTLGRGFSPEECAETRNRVYHRLQEDRRPEERRPQEGYDASRGYGPE